MKKVYLTVLCCLLALSISVIAVSASSSFFSEIVELADGSKGGGSGGGRGGGSSRGGGSRGGRSSSRGSSRGGRSNGGRSSSRGSRGSSRSGKSSGKSRKSGRSTTGRRNTGKTNRAGKTNSKGRLAGRTRTAGLKAAQVRASISKLAGSLVGKFSKISPTLSKALSAVVGPNVAAAYSALAKKAMAVKGPRVNSLKARFNAAFAAQPATAVTSKLTASAIQASVQKQAVSTTTPGYKIDKGLLTKNEAFSTKGYVPNAGKSGVTVGTGFDIGQQNKAGLKSLGLSPSLVDKLSPYTGLKQQAAKNYLAKNPLSLSATEAKAIDKAVMDKSVAALAKDYEAAAAKNPKAVQKFTDLPASVQSVAYSVQHQYGSMKKATPNFFGKLTSNDYQGMVKELRNFGDAYTTRRNREADHLENGLKSEAPQG